MWFISQIEVIQSTLLRIILHDYKILIYFFLAWNEKNGYRQDGKFALFRMCRSRSEIYKTMLAKRRYRYIFDKIFRYWGMFFASVEEQLKAIFFFFSQVLETIGPPYSSDFVTLFMPMVENEEITGTMRGDGENDPLSEFIGKIYKL